MRQANLPDGTEEADPRPIVRLPRQGLPAVVIIGSALIAAMLLFLVLDARRRSAARTSLAPATMGNVFAPPPPLAIPLETTSQPPVMLVTDRVPEPPVAQSRPEAPISPPSSPVLNPVLSIQPVAPELPNTNVPEQVAASEPPVADRSGSSRTTPSAFVIDGAGGANPNGHAAPTQPDGSAPVATGSGATNRGAPGTGGDDAPARATFIGDHATIMPVGTVIPAALETPIDTARPGLVRAIVSRDTRGFDGRRVLVPRGSRLIGEYQADVRSGQNRVLVTWNRLIRPDGATIRLISPTADPLGGAGVPGRVNNFFWQRFGSALLQSALTVGVNLASRPVNSSVIIGVPGNAVSTVGQSLLPATDLRPKIVVKQGAAVNVFVARDLDFSSVAGGQ